MEFTSTQESEAIALLDLGAVDIVTTNLLVNHKGIREGEERVSNIFYSQHGQENSIENLTSSNDRILNTCEETLRNKILEGMVGTNEMESGGPLVLKIMLDIIICFDNSALRALTQCMQTLRLKDFPGDNVCTSASYLKGALLLLQNCSNLPTETMGLLNDTIGSVDCDEFSGFTNYVCFNHERKTQVMTH